MDVASIDISGAYFWIYAGAALLLLAPVVHAAARRWLLALLHLGFIGGLLGAETAALFALAVLVLLGLLRAPPRLRPFALTVLGISTLALFLLQKLPPGAGESTQELRVALRAAGFSYLALRVVELARACADERRARPDFPAAVGYLLPFHMLAAGPIQPWDDYAAAPPLPAALSRADVLWAADRIARGLFKKLVVARALEMVFLTRFQAPPPYLFLEVQANYLWVYLDFSAYSDIAIGVGCLLGVPTPENFARPLAARNIVEFWERWHISLSQYIRRNLFVPIQLAVARRHEGAGTAGALAVGVSFLLCGLWHGVSLRFLAWGGMHATALIGCNLYKKWLQKRLGRAGFKTYLADRRIRAVSTALTFEFVAFSLAFIAYPWSKRFT